MTLLVPLLLLAPALFAETLTAETLKVSPEVLILLVGGFMVLATGVGRALGGRPALGGGAGSRARWALAGVTLWVGVTSGLAFNPRMAWIFAATFITYMLVGQSLLDWLEDGRARRKVLVGALGGLALIQALLGATQLLKWPYRAWADATPIWPVPGGAWPHDFLLAVASGADGGTAFGTLGNPNYLAECLVLLWPVLFVSVLSLRSRWTKVGGFGVLLLIAGVLFGTGARAATGGLILSGLAAAWLVWGTGAVSRLRQVWGSSRGRMGLGLVAAAMVVLLVVAGGPMAAKLQRLGSGIGDESISSRLINWRVAVGMVAERPIQGVGIGNYKALSTAKLAEAYPEGIPEVATKTRFAQAHNEPLQAFVELGLVGGLLLLGALAFWVRETMANESLSQRMRFGLIWGVGAMLVAGLFGFPFHIPVTAIALMAVLALGLASERPAAPVLSAPMRLVYAGVVLAVLGVLCWQVAVKDALPLHAGARYQHLGEKLAEVDSSDTTLTVLGLAERTQRFRVETLEAELRTLVAAEKFDEAIALYDRSTREGMGLGSLYWKGRALRKAGRTQEAYDTFARLAKLYPEGTPVNKRATRYMRGMAREMNGRTEKSAPVKEGR